MWDVKSQFKPNFIDNFTPKEFAFCATSARRLHFSTWWVVDIFLNNLHIALIFRCKILNFLTGSRKFAINLSKKAILLVFELILIYSLKCIFKKMYFLIVSHIDVHSLRRKGKSPLRYLSSFLNLVLNRMQLYEFSPQKIETKLKARELRWFILLIFIIQIFSFCRLNKKI